MGENERFKNVRERKLHGSTNRAPFLTDGSKAQTKSKAEYHEDYALLLYANFHDHHFQKSETLLYANFHNHHPQNSSTDLLGWISCGFLFAQCIILSSSTSERECRDRQTATEREINAGLSQNVTKCDTDNAGISLGGRQLF